MFVSQLMAFGMLFALLFGSTYAVDVLFNWVSGGGGNVGSDLTAAAKESRGLGRQIRILIQAVAGVAIVFYIGLKIYLKNSVKMLDRQRIVATYIGQLEDVCATFLDDASKLTTEVLQASHGQMIRRYEEVKQELLGGSETGRASAGVDFGRGGLGQGDATKLIADLLKWVVAQTTARENVSAVQTQKSATSAFREKIQ